MEPMITESAIEIEDQRVVGRGLFDAMCAQFPDKYIALIQPRASEISRPKATASPQNADDPTAARSC
jgi:hypothetical protein